jgi:twitching motility protein PilT
VPQLDSLIKALFEHRAEALALQPGAPAALRVRGADRPVTKDALSGAQVTGLLREVLAPDQAGALGGTSPFSATYAAPSGTVSLEVTPGNGGPQAVVRPVARAGAGAATPSADPALRTAMDELLRALVAAGGSDLHLRAGQPPIHRVSGGLVRLEQAPLTAERIDGMLATIQSDPARREFLDSGDADWAYEIEGVARFRCNAGRERGGPLAVFRVIPSVVPTVEEMGISPEVQALCQLSKGLVLVTGPTGSGKSTTLAALVDLINRTRDDHLITIEDPVEFVHPSRKCLVTQRQVGVHTRGFKAALRAALREDPDIVLVGELRDLETVAIALETAETGHLVFGTLHTTTAASTVDRIIDQFPADRQAQVRTMLAESLRGVVAQVLCRKIGGGRVAAREILLVTPAVQNLIREGKTFQVPSIMQTSRRIGMVTLQDSLLELVEQGRIEPKEAWMKAADKPGILAALRAKRHDTAFATEG